MVDGFLLRNETLKILKHSKYIYNCFDFNKGKECEVVQVFALRFGIWRQSRPIDCPC